MKLFELKGTLRFYAKDVDDAFRRIGKHYSTISKKGVDSPGIGEPGTEMALRPVSNFEKGIIEEVVEGITKQIKEGAEIARKEAESDEN